MNSGEVVLGGFRDFGARWKDLVAAVAFAVLPVTVLSLVALAAVAPDPVVDLMTNRVTPDQVEDSLGAVSRSEWIRFGIAYGIFGVLSGLANAVALGACLAIEREQVVDVELSYGSALREGLQRALSLVWLFVLSVIPIAVGLILCLLPGIWLLVSWVVAPVILFHEGIKGRRSLSRSFRLVRPAFWFTTLVLLIEVVGLGLIQSAATSLTWVLLPAPLEELAALSFFSVMLLSAIAGLVTVALHACIATRLYLALRARSSTVEAAAA